MEKKKKKRKQSIQELWNDIQKCNIFGIPKAGKTGKIVGKKIKEIIAKKFPKLMKNINHNSKNLRNPQSGCKDTGTSQ